MTIGPVRARYFVYDTWIVGRLYPDRSHAGRRSRIGHTRITTYVDHDRGLLDHEHRLICP